MAPRAIFNHSFLRSPPPVNTEMIGYQKVQYIRCETNRKAWTGSWTQLRPFYGPPTISVPHRGVYPWPGSVCLTPELNCTMRRGVKDKSVPASVAKESVIYVARHTYCFFWACEARSLAFSLAASAVSLARSVAVSAKVLDGVSPTKVITHWLKYQLKYLYIYVAQENLRYPFIQCL